jgi:sigma-B regulation protein RsbU (phosphoserine phosphatase)
MFYRLSPARRIILLVACVLLVLPQTQVSDEHGFRILFPNAGFAAFLLLALLVLELADRVSLKRDLEIAREMQRMLVPQSPPSVAGIDMAFSTRPANTVAGDYYDAFLRAGGKSLMLFVADVAGKGIPSGLLMARFEASVHLLCDESAPLAEVMERLNGTIWQRSGGGRHFITCFAAELDVESRALTWVSAGHNPPLVVRADGKVEWLAQGGLPLGMFPGARYESGRGELRAGDRLLIYTDGVTEASDPADAEFGGARLEKLAVGFGDATAAECLRRVFVAVDAFAGTAPQSDDITCLVLRVAAAQTAKAHG